MSGRAREIATLAHARRQLREHYLADNEENAANDWFSMLAKERQLPGVDVEASDDVVADVVESALWSARTSPGKR